MQNGFLKKKRTEAYVSGCRHQKSDLKPKNFSARINKKKKDLKPKISVCKSNNVTGPGTHIKAASDHKVVPCRIPFFLAFRIMPSKCSTVEDNQTFLST